MSSPTIRLMCGWRELIAEHKASCRRSHPVVGMTEEELERIRQVLAKISYRDWTVMLSVDTQRLALLQVCAQVPDTATGELIENRGRPVVVCPEMSDGFILDLVFELIKEFEVHEAAERFILGGSRVYYPHKPDGVPLFEVPSLRGAPPMPSAGPVEGSVSAAGQGGARPEGDAGPQRQ